MLVLIRLECSGLLFCLFCVNTVLVKADTVMEMSSTFIALIRLKCRSFKALTLLVGYTLYFWQINASKFWHKLVLTLETLV